MVCQHYWPEHFQITEICEELVQRGHQVTALVGIPNYPKGVVPEEYMHGKNRQQVRNGVNIIRVEEIPRKPGIIGLAKNYLSYMREADKMAGNLSSDFDVIFAYQLSPVLMSEPAMRIKKRRSYSADHFEHAQRAQALGELMMADTKRGAHPFAPLVLDDAGSLEDMAAAVMRLHSTLMTVGRCYTTDATGDRAALELGRVESVLAGAFCTIFGQSPANRFADIFDQVTYVAEHMVKDHIFEDGNKRTSLVFALSVLRFAGTPVVLSDSPEPKDNQYYAWIQDLVSSRRTNSELAEELRCGFVAGTGDLSLV